MPGAAMTYIFSAMPCLNTDADTKVIWLEPSDVVPVPLIAHVPDVLSLKRVPPPPSHARFQPSSVTVVLTAVLPARRCGTVSKNDCALASTERAQTNTTAQRIIFMRAPPAKKRIAAQARKRANMVPKITHRPYKNNTLFPAIALCNGIVLA